MVTVSIRIEEFIWLPGIIEKILSKHHVTPEAAEQIFYNRPHYRLLEKGRIHGEDMYTALGQTDAGRYLIIFFIIKPSNKALIISARDMDRSERKYYGRKT